MAKFIVVRSYGNNCGKRFITAVSVTSTGSGELFDAKQTYIVANLTKFFPNTWANNSGETQLHEMLTSSVSGKVCGTPGDCPSMSPAEIAATNDSLRIIGAKSGHNRRDCRLPRHV